MLLDEFLDRTAAFGRPARTYLLREMSALLFHHPRPPDAAALGDGSGHTVLIIPPLLTSDAVMWQLHRFLKHCGFRTAGWGQGINWGPTPRALAGLRTRLCELSANAREPVSVVGISMGGMMARDLAHDHPKHIRQVITVASPVTFPTATTIEPLFRLLAPSYSRDIDVARLGRRPPVPTMALYSSDDGIVDWQSCRADTGDEPSYDVGGAHVTICRNPETLRRVALRLLDTSI